MYAKFLEVSSGCGSVRELRKLARKADARGTNSDTTGEAEKPGRQGRADDFAGRTVGRRAPSVKNELSTSE